MRNFYRRARVAVAAVALALVSAPAFAATTPLDSVTLDTTLYMTGAGIVFVALAAIWPIHKIVRMFNKS